eukprot:5245433-Pyramimonas_sp.AAC.1
MGPKTAQNAPETAREPSKRLPERAPRSKTNDFPKTFSDDLLNHFFNGGLIPRGSRPGVMGRATDRPNPT